MRKRKRIKIKLVVIIILFILVIAALIGINGGKKEEPKKIPKSTTTTTTKAKKELSIAMVGDCLIHRFVYEDASNGNGTYNFNKMLTEVKPLIEGYDLKYYNQESIIGGKSMGLSAYPRFNSPEEIGDAMLDTGFNLVGLSNNHTMDKGEKGVINSVNYWKSKNVHYTGQALSEEEREENVQVHEINGVKYAFLAYTTVTNGLLPPSGKDYLTNIYSDEKVKKDVDKIRNEADVIIVAMHWGVEYTTKEVESQRRIAKYLSELGVDLVIGAHPHVIEPVEMVGDTLVFYSLGNFISGQDTADKLTGALASTKMTIEDGKVTFSDTKVTLLYTYYSRSIPRNFKVYPYKNINNSILNNYETYYNKYKGVLTRYINIEVE